MRRNVKKLVLHFGGAQPFNYAGVLVGLRQYDRPESGRGAQRGQSLESWLDEKKRGMQRWMR